ncbi:hypothetical protein [Candidatus Raskinella chloraquaticus]
MHQMDMTRLTLLAIAEADQLGSSALATTPPLFDTPAATTAIHQLDAAGAIDIVLHSDWDGNRSWRVRHMTDPGREVARLIRDQVIWNRLKVDLLRSGDPFTLLVNTYSDNLALTMAP